MWKMRLHPHFFFNSVQAATVLIHEDLNASVNVLQRLSELVCVALDDLIADDEPLAQRALVRMLRGHDDLSIVAECGEGDTTLAAIDELRPDLVFLDIRMPGLNGIDIASRLFRRFTGSIIFVTAHDSHALEALDLSAFDYLLKPFTAERLAQALKRVRDRSGTSFSPEAFESFLKNLREREALPKYLERIPANKTTVSAW